MELLVVVAVILILLAILFPVVGHLRASAQNVRCINNLRQIGAAATAFSADNNGALLPYALNRPQVTQKYVNGFWYAILYHYLFPGQKWVSFDENIRNPRPGPFFCELADTLYGINRICGWNNSSNPAANPFQTYLKVGQGIVDKSQSTPHGFRNAGRPFPLPGGLAQTAFFADGSGGLVPDNFGEPESTNFPSFRHGGHANVLYMDGHIGRIKNPHFEANPDLIMTDEWVFFFGRSPQP